MLSCTHSEKISLIVLKDKFADFRGKMQPVATEWRTKALKRVTLLSLLVTVGSQLIVNY